jgi:hypothetical protein
LLNHDPSRIYDISPAAVHHHKRFRQFSTVTYILLAIIAALGVWTILKTAGAFGSSIPDLADVASIRDHMATRLVTILAAITLVIFLFKEWRFGDLNFNMIFFLVPLLALWLFPVVAAELEPDLVDFDVEFQLTRCESGAFADGQVDTSLCKIVSPADVIVLMSDAEPHRTDATIRAPQVTANEYHRWFIQGRGEFYIYFLLQHATMEECEGSQMALGRDPSAPYSYECMERDGAVWSVHKFQTSENQTGRLVILQELP